ncbi:hypothetical protein J2S43_003681 [Catenuloplanes nepalensis]|uniref:Uncharacterized protein n=1 Tax=Catenuloplanes nepalensis TaxID=587533 RepID=A0ABT9MUX5_9ACTN|nr:hypothetical protein [Catenuloplanes nepalensis]
MTDIEGTVAPGYERVMDAFAANLGRETGAAVSVYRHGEPVVDPAAGIAFGYVMDRLHADYAQPDTRAANLICAVAASIR